MDIITYLLSLIQSLYQQNCWLINFICRYIPLKHWAFNDKSLTSKNVMVKRYALSADGQNATFRTAVPAPAVMPRNLSFIKIMVPKDSFSVKSAAQGSHPMKAASPL